MESTLSAFSNQLADAIERAAPSVVQVHGRRRPVSGLVYETDLVVTTTRALGRDDRVRVRTHDNRVIEAELAGWDPSTQLAALRAPGLNGVPAKHASASPRVGHLAVAVARSWSNAVTASAGIVSVIGGPLATGRRRAIDRVFRTSAPMHEGFSGGAFLDVDGLLLGLTTAAAIRGLGIVIPADIVWKSAATILQGGLKRGYLGLGGQPVTLPAHQRGSDGREQGILVTAITPGSPSEAAGLLIGDVLLDFDGHPVASPEELLDLLQADRVNHDVPVQVLRGGSVVTLKVRVGERPVG